MDTYEYEEHGPETEHTQPESGLYSGTGAGRKESPFADSPYIMNHQAYEPQQPAYSADPAPEKPKKKGAKVWKGILCAVLALALVAGSCGVTAAVINSRWEEKTSQMTDDFNDKLVDLQNQLDENSSAIKEVSSQNNSGSSSDNTLTVTPVYDMTPGQVYAQNVKAVVLIYSEIVSDTYGQATTGTSAGSGFIITENGYVVTNYHVVEGATSIEVTTYDGDVYPATLVGYDDTNDVAVLKVDGSGLPYVTIGSSDDLAVGDQVVAIGNPLGELTSTMTVGYVSAKDRDVTTDGTTINMIQTDAAINSGNSGGPLFNMKGEVIGITTAKYSGSTSSGATIEGIGFAIPMDDVIGIINDLMEYGYVTGAYLGVMVRTVDSDTANMYGLPMGSYVDSVTEGGAAEKAGVKAKDIIVALGDYEVTSNTDLTRALRKFKAGDTSTITVYRGGQEIELTITFDEKPHDTTEDTTTDQSQMPSNGTYEEWYDFFFGQGGNG